MKTRVRLSLLIICSLICTACTNTAEADMQPQPQAVSVQDTLGMVPDFSYAVPEQIPNIFVDSTGYCPKDKKIAFFVGNNLTGPFEVRDIVSDETVYTGNLHEAADKDDRTLYAGNFTGLEEYGKYYIWQEQIGDSYEFEISDSVYEKEFVVLHRLAEEYTYTNVSDATYTLTNMLFFQEMFGDVNVDSVYMKEKIGQLLYSQDTKSGAFYCEILDAPIDVSQAAVPAEGIITQPEGTVSLTTTAQMAGLLAKYSYLYKETEPVFAMECLRASQKAYKYVEQYRGNTDTDAWYFAATELFRTTGQYQYRNAIREYDAMEPGLKSRTMQNYTILADFTYLSTAYGTDYNRCALLLDKYMDRAQEISVSATKENFYVHSDIETMSDCDILDDMIILGIVNHVLSGQEYEGIERNYIHYLSGANMEAKNYLAERMLVPDPAEGVNITNVAKLLVIFGNMG